ncbi:hypothetical protein Ahy_B03g065795 [Arachis hypogaea]|uniref:Uncharacterized protein n=1 Tax=Arachis hypogaea TaxID=3818 RepID=A0A445A2F5_ARAHY|nr:hypothetical protein Ahy_B03g065795 [Arachis hypogaea]
MEKLFYRIPIFAVGDFVKYDAFVIKSDDNLQVLFHCCCPFSDVRSHELLAMFGDVLQFRRIALESSICMLRASNSMLVVAYISMAAVEFEAVLLAFMSFKVDPNCVNDGEIGDNRSFEN